MYSIFAASKYLPPLVLGADLEGSKLSQHWFIRSPDDPDKKKLAIMNAMSNFSFELTPAFAQKLFLPEGKRTAKQEEMVRMLRKIGEKPISADGKSERTKVYITKLPTHPQEDTIKAVRAVHQFADHLEAVPHVPVRGFRDREDLQQFIQAMTGTGDCKIDFRPVEHILVVGGSLDDPVGEFSESLQVLESGILQQNGVKRIGMAAHPQGADNIKPEILDEAFEKKLKWSNKQMTEQDDTVSFDWSTQLAYNPQAIIQWEKDIRAGNYNGKNCQSGMATKNNLPIRLGIPGPASAAQLAKYAQISGVSTSINYFKNNPVAAWNLLTKRSVLDDLVVEISEYMEKEKDHQLISGFHFFTFGAITKTLEWACKVKSGDFDVTEEGKIRIHEDECLEAVPCLQPIGIWQRFWAVRHRE